MTAVWVALMVPGYLVLGSVAVRVTDTLFGSEPDESRWLFASSIVFWPAWLAALLAFLAVLLLWYGLRAFWPDAGRYCWDGR